MIVLKRLVLTLLTASVSFIIGLKSSRTDVRTEVVHQYHNVTDTLYKTNTDTIFIDQDKHLFRSVEDYVLFIKYVKTQSNRVSTDFDQSDVWSVIQTMCNRMNDSGVNWNTYYTKKSINRSESISKMKSRCIRPGFDWNNDKDLWMITTAINTSLGLVPDSLYLQPNVLYFESFKRCPNRRPHWCDSLVVQYRHKFYKGFLHN